MRPAVVNLNDHTSGDTWEGITVGPVLINGIAVGADAVTCRMSFRSKNDRSLGQTLTTTNSDITIEDAATWEFTVEPTVLTMDAGSYGWDFEVTDSSGVIRTLYKGSFNLIQDVTI